ncbi:type IV secretory pathway TrbL component [Paraburkholderia sp. MM5496-R1]
MTGRGIGLEGRAQSAAQAAPASARAGPTVDARCKRQPLEARQLGMRQQAAAHVHLAVFGTARPRRDALVGVQ